MRMVYKEEQMNFPELVKAFMKELLSKTGSKEVFIPFARGEDVALCQECGVSVDYENPNVRICERIVQDTGIEALQKRIIEKKYNFVFSDLPFGSVGPNAVYVPIVESALEVLADNGKAMFTFAPNIVFALPAKKWMSRINEKGVFVEAIIDLPAGTYAPLTMIESRILIFSKEQRDKIFLAQAKDINDVEYILENYLEKKDSRNNERFGIWQKRDESADYSTYEKITRAERTIKRIENDYNGSLISLNELAESIEAPKKDGFSEEKEDSVYIPKIGKSNVVTRISDFEIKSHNYFRVIVKTDRILPEYLAFYLNTESGVEIRLRSMNGVTIPSINTSGIKEIIVPVPPVEFQSEVLKIYSELNQISMETERLREKLRRMPVSYKSIKKEIKEINNRGDKFEQWMESLPYPIATILKRYQVASSDKDKQEILLFFFEAYSIFVSTILVGAYSQYHDESNVMGDVDASYFEKASFGSWVRMMQALSKTTRKALDNKERIDRVLECFAVEDRSIVLQLCNSEINKILQGACNNRNLWKGHPGITGEPIYAEHVRVLEDDLKHFQEKMPDLYERAQLIRPIGLRCKNGVFINSIEILSGSNPLFKKSEYIGEPLDESKLYFFMKDTNGIIELPPFFVMKNSPADVKNACYFYSRIEGNNSRYVSYHFDRQPEDIEQGSAAFTVIKEFLDMK